MSENEIDTLAVRSSKDEPQAPIPPVPDFAEKNDDKRERNSVTEVPDTQPQTRRHAVGSRLGSLLWRFEQQLVEYNLEARGIERVGEDERMKRLSWVSYLQAFLLWVSINLAANNITLGMLGPAVYGLSFRDSALCGVFGAFVGAIVASWMATWGPISGIRTMAFGRYSMGWWPSKIIVLLNLIQMIGYCLIDCVVGGQILSAVSPNGMSVAVGIVIIAVISWVVATFGIQVFHYYERFAFLPQLIVFCILFGVSSVNFDLSTASQGASRTVSGNRLSFFSICLSAAITYAPLAADFFVYYPSHTSRTTIFSLTLTGLVLSFTMAFLAGIGLASGIPTNSSYAAAYARGQGALIVEGFAPLHGFGKFCSVIVALGLIANTVAPTYSSGVDFQILGRYAEKVPRVIWNTVGVVIYTVCALAGRGYLSEIFTNFLALMGYWVAIWVAIILEERFIFRLRSGYNWAAWRDPSKLPVGVAAFLAFVVGWVGAVLCMAQVWYVGPLAKLVSAFGADMGNYVGFSWAALVYPPMRWVELRFLGR
ncbi:Permease cytosine/purine uracil thiamine allantoin [Penicillium riverlandense]|uniref:Permease cytosine/purine uracil thiamine allantoin n=1 Tax=Penicillium riverlandense TaxID=1903569 RepID=UPI002547BEAA|nr:Permease cytosine/purine uracil thiamine allantoin [Penicillium riverlandense]KAJ5808680.1 Permease cytosine/purine uracil thiamine allantoin [Penicillium riverlandense]